MWGWKDLRDTSKHAIPRDAAGTKDAKRRPSSLSHQSLRGHTPGDDRGGACRGRPNESLDAFLNASAKVVEPRMSGGRTRRSFLLSVPRRWRRAPFFRRGHSHSRAAARAACAGGWRVTVASTPRRSSRVHFDHFPRRKVAQASASSTLPASPRPGARTDDRPSLSRARPGSRRSSGSPASAPAC
jgi:hypothetical protein